MRKKITSFILILILVFSTGTVAFATEESKSDKNNQIKVTEEVICEIATNWAQAINPELNIQANNVVKIYNNQNVVMSYSVGYFVDNEPYGYAIIDFTAQGYIGEYNIEPGITDLYTNIIEKNEISSYSVAESKLVTGLPYEYAIPSGDKVFSMSGMTRTEDEYSEYQKSILEQMPALLSEESVYNGYYESGDIFINAVPATYRRTAENNFPDFIGIDEYSLERQTQHYACGPVALAIVGRLGYLDFDTSNAFLQLWDYTNTHVVNLNLDNGVTYGGTYIPDIGPGFVNYARNVWNTDVKAYRQDSVQFGRIRDLIDSSILHTFQYGIYVNGEYSGHVIVPQGYIVASDNHGSSENFVKVADGWNSYPRYLNFSTRGFADHSIWYFTGISPN